MPNLKLVHSVLVYCSLAESVIYYVSLTVPPDRGKIEVGQGRINYRENENIHRTSVIFV